MDRRPDSDDRQWRIGELAKRTGLSVRALRHYDEIGLLVPSERSRSGYKTLYSGFDLRRLYRIVAMRQLGMSLEQIARVLDGAEVDLRATVRGQLAALERQLDLQERLRVRLRSILQRLDRETEPSTDLFIDAIEVTTMIEKHYTPDQLDQVAQRARELGPEAIEPAQGDWAELIAAVRRERDAGTDATSARMQEFARRWQEPIGQFTGANPKAAQLADGDVPRGRRRARFARGARQRADGVRRRGDPLAVRGPLSDGALAATTGHQAPRDAAEAGLGNITAADWQLVTASVGKSVGPDASGKIEPLQPLLAWGDSDGASTGDPRAGARHR